MKARPSTIYLGVVLRAYLKARDTDPTIQGVWNEVCKECILRGSFERVFAWQTSKKRNDLRVMARIIQEGWIPVDGEHILAMAEDGQNIIEIVGQSVGAREVAEKWARASAS